MARRPRAHRAAPSPAARARWRKGAPTGLRALLIALGVLVAQGATLLHLMMVPHTTCEHGELVEVHAAPRTEALAQKTSEPRVETAVPDERDHQHCDINARLHRLPEVNAPVGDAELLCIEPRATLGARPERRPVGLLSLAPKSSPPSA